VDLKTLHHWELKYQLRAVPGVSEVNTWGGFTRKSLPEPGQLVPDSCLATTLSGGVQEEHSSTKALFWFFFCQPAATKFLLGDA
jgi:hypothetical protein